MVIFNHFDRICSLGILLLAFYFFYPGIRSTPAEAVATSTMPVEASPCMTATGSRIPQQICP